MLKCNLCDRMTPVSDEHTREGWVTCSVYVPVGDSRYHVRVSLGACPEHAETFLATLATSKPIAAAMRTAQGVLEDEAAGRLQ